MNTIVINGKRINVEGNSISIINNKAYVDGKEVESGLQGVVEVKFEGDLANLKADGSVKVSGNIDGSVSAGGSVDCDNVGKNVSAGGSVRCGKVGGSISAGGSVRHS